DKAVEAGTQGSDCWRKTCKEERAKYLVEISGGMEEKMEDLGRIESLEKGKGYGETSGLELGFVGEELK
ncbi:aldehyde dehydrogenase family protein, partial [Staphylococcus argensis]|uniref:aldehyde dehydrogenase family protein n=1 Tax=Staphylococcus argensis TaxID=1607738 RepID=UPI0011AA34CC